MKDVAEQESGHFSIEAEQQIIGAVLSNNSIFWKVCDVLKAEDFYEPTHGRIWQVCASRIAKEHLASPVTMKEALADDEGLKALGGLSYLAKLVGGSISTFAAPDYARIITTAHHKRRVEGLLHDALGRLGAEDGLSSAVASLQAGLVEIPEGGDAPSSQSLLVAMEAAVTDALKAHRGETKLVKTGIGALDGIIRGLAPGDFCLLGGATSMGKAQPLSSKVLTVDGWKLMGDIVVGDRLASVDGSPSEVLAIFPQGEKEIYEVEFSDGRSARCCEDHLWEVVGSFFKHVPRVVSTKTLIDKLKTKSAKGRIVVPLFGGEYGRSESLPIDPWVLGAFIGNGHFSEGGTPVFSTQDASTLYSLVEILGSDQTIYKAGGYDYRISGSKPRVNPFAQMLIEMGLRGRRAENKFVPEMYLDASLDDRKALLRGLLDTDGWVEKFGAVRYSTSSGRLAEQVCYLVRSIGGVCSISEKMPKFTYNGERKVGQKHYVLNIRVRDASELFSVLHKKRRCGRKKPVALSIKSIRAVGVESAVCIKVSHGRSLYVTDGFVLTHNTSAALEIARNVSMQGQGVAFWSLEMSPSDLAARMMSSQSRVPYALLRDAASMDEADLRKWAEKGRDLETAALRIIPKWIRDIPAGLAAIKRAQTEMGVPLSLVVVDYAQLLRGEGKTQYEKMTSVSTGLKTLAGLLNVPVVGLVQLSRSIGGREDKRPQLSDIKETGQFENDADQVIFCHREGYWLQRQGPKLNKDGQVTDDARADWIADMERHKNRMELIVRKNRHGGLATAEVGFHDATCRFWQLGSEEDFE